MRYFGDFCDWEDVSKAFGIDMPEPDVLYAEYNHDGYDGSAYVCYRDDENVYIVKGGHCSCYGLEGGWSPIDVKREDAKKFFEHYADKGYGIEKAAAQAILNSGLLD